jgi:hypothetical protein
VLSAKLSLLRGIVANLVQTGPVSGYPMSTPWRQRPPGWPTHHTKWLARGYHTGADWETRGKEGVAVTALNTGYAIRHTDRILGKCVLLFWECHHWKFTSWYCHLAERTPLDRLPTKLIMLTDHHGRYETSVVAHIIEAGHTLGVVGSTGIGVDGPMLHLEKRQHWTNHWCGIDMDPMRGWAR